MNDRIDSRKGLQLAEKSRSYLRKTKSLDGNKRSLHNDIFKLVVGLLLLTSATIMVNVWWVTYEQAQQRMSKDISVAEQVLTKIIDYREELLYTSARVLTDDFGFRQAVASRDEATIVSALDNHGRRISADLMAIVSLDGELIAHSLSSFQQSQQPSQAQANNDNDANNAADDDSKSTDGFIRAIATISKSNSEEVNKTQIQMTIEQGGLSSYFIVNGRLFKINMLRIDAPRPIAVALIGFELDSSLIDELNSLTNLNAWIEASDSALTDHQLKSNDLPLRIVGQAQADQQPSASERRFIMLEDLDWFDLLFNNGASVVKEVLVYNKPSFVVKVVLTQHLSALISEFSSLKTSISVIITISCLFAFFMAALYSRKLSKPLSDLAEIAQLISTGNYKQNIKIQHDSREFRHLAQAFDSMQINISEREKEISYRAQHDPLTDLYTRYHIETLINQAIEKGQRFQAIGINIVGFRGLNDVFGNQYGDVCLSVLAHRIKKLGGIAARLSGGEFLWISEHTLSDGELSAIKQQLERKIVKDDVHIPLRLSLGWLACPEQAECSLELLKRINIVLDEAKKHRQRSLQFTHSLEEKYERRLQIITKLKRALACNSDNLSLAYQPKLSLESQSVDAVEALIRWIDPDLGFIPPDEFIAIAEQSGLIRKVTHWVVDRAINDAQILRDEGLRICIAVNLSAKDLADPLLLPSIKAKTQAAKLAPSALSFEITEGDLVEDAKAAAEQLNAYRIQGHKLAIDDFGTGYSSLAYLKSFQVNTLKIDKSFVLELDKNQNDQDIVQTILQLAQKFNLSVVAEGVENLASMQYLAEHGCTWVQGYYVCRPIPLQDFVTWHQANINTNWLEREKV